MFKQLIQRALERSARTYFKKHHPKLIVVAGSVGKTGTKTALATVLSEKYHVRAHTGNHNSSLSAPLSVLGVEYPDDVHSIGQWLAVFRAIRLRIKQPDDTDVIIQELGTDSPGDIMQFSRYLQPDFAVVTAVSPEHMQAFGTLDAVAKEELSVVKFSQFALVNRDDVDHLFAKYAETQAISTYGLTEPAEYRIELDGEISPLEGKMGRFISPEFDQIPVTLQLIGTHNIKAAVAAGAIGVKLGLSAQQIAVGIAKIVPVAGRMRVLEGVEKSTIIDDTYNSSPRAVIAALDTLYSVAAPQRIAVLGSMNDLGAFSQEAHEQVGAVCDPAKLAWVVTIGADAAHYLAPTARAKGCQVKSFDTPYEAGAFVHSVIDPGTVVLVKGSQDGVFAEEAVKIILHDTEDEQQLVRQSPEWLARKKAQFSTL